MPRAARQQLVDTPSPACILARVMTDKVVPRAYPLQWPDGWPRTAQYARRRAPYKVPPGKAISDLVWSLGKLGADRRKIIISTNVPVRNDGLPYATTSRVDDPGVAVYWTTTKMGEMSVGCDKWDSTDSNIRAIGLSLEGLRAMDRAGATQILDRAFQAFGALPPATVAPVTRPWWEVFEMPEAVATVLTMPMIEARYRELAAKHHPDKLNGSQEAFVELGIARDQARAHFGETA